MQFAPHNKNKTMKIKIYMLLFAVSFGAIQSCKEEEKGPSINDQKKQAIETYATIVLASYEDSYNTAATLKQKIDAFVAAPSAILFEECKTAWRAARIPYGQTEAYRFANGPIDDEGNGPEGLINAWPMDEAFIDYVAGDVDAGLINNLPEYPTISKTVLEDLNESISETSIFTGYHAIEFLLWGQDLSTSGPGTRPFTDYLTTPNGTASNQQRRGQYLKAVTELLLDHLAYVRDEWKTTGTYRKALVANADVAQVLGNIFNGIGELSKAELPTERMAVAVDTQDQENEHSCFSDNTHIDINMNYLGIKNVYFGTYTRIDGTVVKGKSFAEIAKSLNATKAAAVDAAVADIDAKIVLIPSPFDQAIINSPTVILNAVESLKDLSDRLSDAALALGAKQ
jgi:putative iron-regulated protein